MVSNKKMLYKHFDVVCKKCGSRDIEILNVSWEKERDDGMEYVCMTCEVHEVILGAWL